MVDELMLQALKEQRVSLPALVARVALWAHPKVHRRLLGRQGCAAMFPNVRQARLEFGERPGQQRDGVLLDDDCHALAAITTALGLPPSMLAGFAVCHVWPEAARETFGHTAIANLVLLPRSVASWVDGEPEIGAALRYRAYHLYRWCPAKAPERPEGYPRRWQSPCADPLDPRPAAALPLSLPARARRPLAARLRRWSANPGSHVHRILALLRRMPEGMPRAALLHQVAEVTGSRNPAALLHAMMTERGNAYGAILEERQGWIRIRDDVRLSIVALPWRGAAGQAGKPQLERVAVGV
ncbi:MAG: hypothetical protein AB7E55_24120 [Pigmentiphaga sp.]